MSNLFFTNDTLKEYTNSIKDYIPHNYTNPNLLYNADFRNYNSVINQRGNTNGYSSSDTNNGIYGYDGWTIINGIFVMNKTPGMMHLEPLTLGTQCIMVQHIEFPEKLYGKTVTVSASVSSSVGIKIISTTVTIPLTVPDTIQYYSVSHPDFDSNNAHLILQFGSDGAINVYLNNYGSPYYILNVKLELGSVSTLVNDPPQDYNTELIKAMKYQIVYNPYDVISFIPYYVSANELRYRVILPTSMRITPVIENGLINCRDINSGSVISGMTYSIGNISKNKTELSVFVYKENHGRTKDNTTLTAPIDNISVFSANI